jgi:hypothetical protein
MTTNVRIVRKIVVNGVEYHSLDELPPDLRAKYEKALATEGLHDAGLMVNGQHYDSLDAVPPELGPLVGDAVGTPQKSGNLIAMLVVVIAMLVGVILFLLRAR